MKKQNVIGYLAGKWSLKQFIFWIVLIFFLISILFPFYWMVSSSFKSYAEIGGREPVYVPSKLRLDAYLNCSIPITRVFKTLGAISSTV